MVYANEIFRIKNEEAKVNLVNCENSTPMCSLLEDYFAY